MKIKSRIISCFLLVALIISFGSSAAFGTVHRISFLFIHYSVGYSALNNCQGADGNIRNSLDTMTVVQGADTARIVLRAYNINYDHVNYAISDTVNVWSGADWCDIERYLQTGYDYDLQGTVNRNRIFDVENYSPLLRNFFQKPNKEDSVFWTPFTEHYIPYPNGDSAWESYDLVIIKNPYIIWQNFTDTKADSIKKWYREVRDSVLNHPEINVAFAMGTPLAFSTGSADDFQGDTSMAKIVYDLATWFDSDNFFTHNNAGTYKNVWKWNSYQPMCETAQGSSERYCLKTEYWAGSSAQAHLSSAGQQWMQENLVTFIRNAAQDLLALKAGVVTRRDIDLMIKAFSDGNATEQEVTDLINQYNNQ